MLTESKIFWSNYRLLRRVARGGASMENLRVWRYGPLGVLAAHASNPFDEAEKVA